MRALKIMQDTVRLVDGQYEVGAIFDKPVEEVVEEMNKIPSANTAICRLHRLGDKLADNPDEWNMVKTHVNLLVEKGYAERVGKYPEALQDAPKDRPVFYIPLHPTQDKRKPEKRRITHDCAAKTHKKCLNDFFLKGPDLAASLLHLLLRFRQHPYTLMSDMR